MHTPHTHMNTCTSKWKTNKKVCVCVCVNVCLFASTRHFTASHYPETRNKSKPLSHTKQQKTFWDGYTISLLCWHCHMKVSRCNVHTNTVPLWKEKDPTYRKKRQKDLSSIQLLPSTKTNPWLYTMPFYNSFHLERNSKPHSQAMLEVMHNELSIATCRHNSVSKSEILITIDSNHVRILQN